MELSCVRAGISVVLPLPDAAARQFAGSMYVMGQETVSSASDHASDVSGAQKSSVIGSSGTGAVGGLPAPRSATRSAADFALRVLEGGGGAPDSKNNDDNDEAPVVRLRTRSISRGKYYPPPSSQELVEFVPMGRRRGGRGRAGGNGTAGAGTSSAAGTGAVTETRGSSVETIPGSTGANSMNGAADGARSADGVGSSLPLKDNDGTAQTMTRKRTRSSFSIFPHQVAGHGGIRMFGHGRLIKPAIPQEVSFYENLKSLPFLRPFVPSFHGTLDLRDDLDKRQKPRQRPPEKPLGKNQFIVLEDISCRFDEPCVLDLKMGTRHYSEHADQEKRERSIRKCRESTSSALGFRVCGMQVYHSRTSQFLRRDKAYGRRLTQANVIEALQLFLWNGGRYRLDVVPHFLKSLQDLVEVMGKLPDYRFFSSSLLLIYDGVSPSVKIDLRMIDFAKAYRYSGRGVDEGFLLGLRSLITCFERIMSQADRPPPMHLSVQDPPSVASPNADAQLCTSPELSSASLSSSDVGVPESGDGDDLGVKEGCGADDSCSDLPRPADGLPSPLTLRPRQCSSSSSWESGGEPL